MKNFINKMTAKAITKTMTVKHYVTKVIQTDSGMEVVQVLIVVIISVTLGGILLGTLETEFASLLGKVSTKMNALFGTVSSS